MKKNQRQNRTCFYGRNVIIIGATGGLGKAYTEMFLKEGANVYLGVRCTKNLLNQYHDDEHVKIGHIDIQEPETIENFINHVKKDWGYVDYVINATGFDVRKELLKHSNEDIQNSININLTGAVYITRYFLTLLKVEKESAIVHMGGFVDGGLAFPYYSVDVATRSGLFSFCESMNRELKQEGRKCHLTYFCPNPANTQAEIPYHPIWKEMKTKISSVEEVAEALKRALIKRKEVSIMGGALESGFSKLNHISVQLSNWLLMNTYSRILKKYLGSVKETRQTDSMEKSPRANNLIC